LVSLFLIRRTLPSYPAYIGDILTDHTLGLITLSAGSGFPVLIRSLLNALVEPHHVGILNTLIGFLEVAGLMVASPTLAAAMRGGLNMGGAWVGLPFMVSVLLFVVASAIVFAFRLPPPEVQRELAD